MSTCTCGSGYGQDDDLCALPKEVKWTVVGLYEDDGDGYQRWCDVIEAPTADEAALLAPEGILVAGVFEGEMSTADTEMYAR